MKNTMNKLFLSFFVAVPLLFLSCSGSDSGGKGGDQPKETRKRPPVPEKPNKIIYYNANRIFKDGNDTHLSAAKKIGIRPLADREAIEGQMMYLRSIEGDDKPYAIDKLTHSSPYLVPEAAALLCDIGYNFQDSLRNKHLPEYSVIVTSVLRTDADVKSLSKRNINASQRSVHCYGTTVDVSYARFKKHDDNAPDVSQTDLKAVLTEVLRDLRNQERCYVKYEIKQGCFHITARK